MGRGAAAFDPRPSKLFLTTTNMKPESNLVQWHEPWMDAWLTDSIHDDPTEALRRASFVFDHLHDHVRIVFTDGSIMEEQEIPGPLVGPYN